jgi:hypothetical protein
MPISQETIDKVKADNPGVELEQLSHPGLPDELIVARPPTRGVYTIFLQKHEDGKGIEGNEMLCDACIVYPDKPALQKLFNAKPALPHLFATQIRGMAGSLVEITRKKI